MRIFIVDTVYSGFLTWLYQEYRPGLAEASFAEQSETQTEGFFHTAGAWAPALRDLGHEVLEISANNAPMQVRWMLENDLLDRLAMTTDGQLVMRSQAVPWQIGIVAEQVRRFQPDVLLSANLYLFADDFLAMVDGFYGKSVGQHAADMLAGNGLGKYDLIVSSLPKQVELLRQAGIRAEHLGLAFDRRLTGSLVPSRREYEVGFVGSMSPQHLGRARFLTEVASRVEVNFWGNIDWPPGTGAADLRIRPRAPVFGLPMYQILQKCRMTLNYHIDAAGPYANNLRLFEATGVGSLLVTDDKINIRDYFVPGEEIVTFLDAADCANKIEYFSNNPDEAEAIAISGQTRTLRDHTYHQRAVPLLEMIDTIRH